MAKRWLSDLWSNNALARTPDDEDETPADRENRAAAAQQWHGWDALLQQAMASQAAVDAVNQIAGVDSAKLLEDARRRMLRAEQLAEELERVRVAMLEADLVRVSAHLASAMRANDELLDERRATQRNIHSLSNELCQLRDENRALKAASPAYRYDLSTDEYVPVGAAPAPATDQLLEHVTVFYHPSSPLQLHAEAAKPGIPARALRFGV